MALRLRFPEREDALRGNVEVVDDQDRRVAIGHLEIDGLLGVGPFTAAVRFVGHAERDGIANAVTAEPVNPGATH